MSNILIIILKLKNSILMKPISNPFPESLKLVHFYSILTNFCDSLSNTIFCN